MPPSIVCMHHVGDHPADPLGRRVPSTSTRDFGRRLRIAATRPHGIVDVVIDVGDDVGDARDLPFDRAGAMLRIGADRHAALPFRMPRDAVAHLPRQVQPLTVVLEHVDDAQALLVVIEAAGNELVEDALAGMTERRVPEIVAERDGFGQLFVEPQHLGDASRNLRDLQRVRQARAVVIAGRREEHLRLVLQPAERLAMNDAIAIALKRRPDRILRLRPNAPLAVGALCGLRREDFALALFQLLSQVHLPVDSWFGVLRSGFRFWVRGSGSWLQVRPSGLGARSSVAQGSGARGSGLGGRTGTTNRNYEPRT